MKAQSSISEARELRLAAVVFATALVFGLTVGGWAGWHQHGGGEGEVIHAHLHLGAHDHPHSHRVMGDQSLPGDESEQESGEDALFVPLSDFGSGAATSGTILEAVRTAGALPAPLAPAAPQLPWIGPDPGRGPPSSLI